MQQALQDQTTELTATLSTATARRPRVLVVVSPEDVKDGVLEVDGLQQTLALVVAMAAEAAAMGAAVGASHNATTAV